MEKKKRMNIYSVEEQMEKYNLSREEAEDKIKKIKNVNVFSIEWQMKKFNLTKEEAEVKINDIKNKLRESQENMSEFDFNSMIPSKKEHWMKKGFSEEESIKLSKSNIEIATKNCKDFISKVKKNPEEYKDIMNTQVGFYIKRGFSEEESIKILSKRQSTFNLNKCVEKYGQEKGYDVWKSRQENWYEKTKNKLSKGDYLKYESILKEFNDDEDLANKILVERFLNLSKSKFGRASKRSLRIFNQLIEICEKNNLNYKIGKENNSEFYIFDSNSKKIYFYDFTIPAIKIIFEFQGKIWHSKTLEENNKNPFGFDLTNQFNIDKTKKELAEKNGFEVIYLWEEDGFEYNMKKSIDILNKKLSKNLSKFN